MDADRIARLTDKQRECLRLVNLHMSSKMMAPLLGVTPEAVDQRVKTAVRVLAVQNRFEAALLLARHEGGTTYEQTVYQSPDVASEPAPHTMDASTDGERQACGEASDGPMREDRSPYGAARRPRTRWFPLPLPMRGTKPHDVRLWLRLAWVAAVAIGSAVAFGALVSGVEALVRLVRS